MMNWVAGDGSERIVTLFADRYHHSRVKAVSSTFGKTFEFFSPFMSSKSMFTAFMEDDKYIHDGTLLNFDQEYLEWFSQGCRKNPDFLLFPNPEFGCVPFVDVNLQAPELYTEFSSAWELLINQDNWLQRVCLKVCKKIVPLIKESNRYYRDINSASNHHMLGLILVSACSGPHRVIELAMSMVHEIGHQALMLLQSGSGVKEASDDSWTFSGVRGTLRPIVMSLHAGVALAYMAEFCRLTLRSESLTIDQINFLELSRQDHLNNLRKTLRGMRGHTLTNLGTRVVRDLSGIAYA